MHCLRHITTTHKHAAEFEMKFKHLQKVIQTIKTFKKLYHKDEVPQ